MYSPTTRLLTVLELLQTQGSATGPELARRLEIDVRSVRRYVTLLRDMGIPVESDPGRGGAYYLRPGYRPPPLIFTTEEIMALTLGLMAARQLGMAGATGVESASAKIARVLPDELRERIHALHHVLVLDVPRYTPAAQALLDRFSLAAYQERQLWMTYRASPDRRTERVVDVYGLVNHTGNWYAVCYCHLRQDIRSFRLDRVEATRVLDSPFQRPTDFDALRFLLESIARVPAAWQIKVKLHLPYEEARARVPATTGVVEPDGAEAVLHGWSDGLQWMARFLINLGCRFTIVQPVELWQAVRKVAQQVLDETEARPPSHG